jgi:CheY-like chemotaxis protein/nitrogen-specific signal transduction histidine kinase
MHTRFAEELKETNRQLEQRNQEVERANRLKSEFLASMSHELRTPLHTVIGFAELLAEESQGPLNEKQKRYVKHIHRDSQHLLELINDVLDLSRIEAGRLDLHCEDFTVRPAVEEVVSSIGALAMVKSIELTSHLAGQLMIYADRLRFKEILMNLLSNAVKFTPSGGQITVTAEERGEFVEFSVSDTGIGIAPEEHKAIFDTFYQVGSTTKGVREGTGLGLTICQHLVERQGGRISVESMLGKGSTFRFTMPVGPDATPEPEPEPESPLVLVAEPDESARELLINHLVTQGYRTESALTAEETLRLARNLKPDAIALDLSIATGGWGTLQKLLKAPDTASIPLIVISSQDENKSAIALGAAAYLVKPVKKEVFLEALKKHISPRPGHSTRVLAVDDDPDSLQLLQEFLSNAGFTTVTAASGREALETLARVPVDVAIIDLVMPEMSGFELILRIKENPHLESLPLLVLTGRDLTEQDYDVLQRKTKAVFLKASSWRGELLRRLDGILRPVRR